MKNLNFWLSVYYTIQTFNSEDLEIITDTFIYNEEE